MFAVQCAIGVEHDEQEIWESDGTIKLHNPHIKDMEVDFLYHLGLDTAANDLHKMFHDVKFVCMGGAPKRMEKFAYLVAEELGVELPVGCELKNIVSKADRFAMYKVGPVISVSHGMGIPSLTILLHEMIKLMYYSKAKDPIFLRVGTSGGIGVPPGSVVVTDGAVDGMLNNEYVLAVLGKEVRRPAVFDESVIHGLLACANETKDGYQTVRGKTLATHDFYEAQGRLDGAFCDYTEKDKMDFLRTLQSKGVKNVEMEAVAFGAMCHHAGIKSGIICVTFLDRLNGDQVDTPKSVLEEWKLRPQTLAAKFIKRHLNGQVIQN